MKENLFDIIWLKETDSTQRYIIEKDCECNFWEYTVVAALNQTKGRGQGSNTWESEEGKNISMSLLLKPVFIKPAEQFIISQAVSLAIVDTLSCYIKTNDIFIKWPNDIYVRTNKISGFLVNNKIIGDTLDKSYIGIGININQKKFVFAPNPTSVILETGQITDLKEFILKLTDNIYNMYTVLKNNGSESIRKRYLRLLLFKGQLRKYVYNGLEVQAEIMSVNKFGHIIFRTSDGEVHESDMGKFKFII